MQRRNFLMSVAGFLGVGKLFAKEQQNLPVVEFKDGKVINADKLFAGIKFSRRTENQFGRSVMVWVEEKNAFSHGYRNCWGEVELYQTVWQFGDYSASGATQLLRTESSQIKRLTNDYYAMQDNEAKELLNKLRKEV